MQNIEKFEDFNISEKILKAINEMGFEAPSPIQLLSIPKLLEGKDLIGQAQTGTGKTCAFGIPMIEKINSKNYVQGLVLCPTRELSIQVTEELKKLSKYKKLEILPVYGGQSIERQINILKKHVDIVVGTPGRVIDHLERGTLKLDNLNFFVLDEMDEMLNMGFQEDVEKILSYCTNEKQIALFSATIPETIINLAKKYLKNPEIIKVVHKELTVPSIQQYYFQILEKDKTEVLCRLIDINDFKLSLVFCNKKVKVDELADSLANRGYQVGALHGDMKQSQREFILKKFRKGQIEILIATDVAARGLDINNVEAVFNYDIPYDEEYYVHRIGRTGRAGKTGIAYTFVVGKEIYKLKDIERYAKIKIPYKKVPSIQEIEESKLNKFVNKVIENIKNQDEYYEENKVLNILLSKNIQIKDICLYLIKKLLSFESSDYQEIDEIEPHFSSEKKSKNNKTRFFINLGRKDNITPYEIVNFISSNGNINPKKIGNIDIYDKFSFVDIYIDNENKLLEKIDGIKYKRKKIGFEVANIK
ncbi:MAG: RNA helicase [Candidatus Sericytochromatia bacterium]|nr:MAG: RNA helicase [Candidatus Sericytochromatia bacterium]